MSEATPTASSMGLRSARWRFSTRASTALEASLASTMRAVMVFWPRSLKAR
jgi:hypothetical protein